MSLERTKRDDRRALALLALVTLSLFVVLAVWAKYISPAAWELQALTALAAQPPPLAAAVVVLNGLGNLPVWAVVIAIASVIVGFVRGLAAASLVALTLASDLFAFVVKVLVQRDRPDTAAVHESFAPDNFAYPSGHTVRAAALLAVLIWLFLPARWRLPAAVIGGTAAGLVMGYARVSLGVHWPTDVVGGTLLGLGWFAVTAALVWVEPFRAATLETPKSMSAETFFAKSPLGLAAHRRVTDILSASGEFQVRVSKSQVAYRRRRGFAYLWLPGRYLANPQAEVVLSIALGRRVESDRFKEVVQRSTRHWLHHLEIHDVGDLDQEVAEWLTEAASRAS